MTSRSQTKLFLHCSCTLFILSCIHNARARTHARTHTHVHTHTLSFTHIFHFYLIFIVFTRVGVPVSAFARVPFVFYRLLATNRRGSTDSVVYVGSRRSSWFPPPSEPKFARIRTTSRERPALTCFTLNQQPKSDAWLIYRIPIVLDGCTIDSSRKQRELNAFVYVSACMLLVWIVEIPPYAIQIHYRGIAA